LRRERTIDALIALLHRRAAITPLVMVVEDLHWADPSTVEFLDRLSMLRNASLLTLLTARLDFSPSWSSPSAITPVQLRRLPHAEARRMIAAIAKTALPADVADLVAKTTEGIPLFIEALTRLVEQSPASAAGTGFSSGPVPTTLREALNARLDRLGPARILAEQARRMNPFLGRRAGRCTRAWPPR
jgi:predicted ATPase